MSAGLTQAGLAAKIGLDGVTPQTVGQWEINKATPQGTNLIELAKALGTTIPYLETGSDGEQPRPEQASEPTGLDLPPWLRAYSSEALSGLKRVAESGNTYLVEEVDNFLRTKELILTNPLSERTREFISRRRAARGQAGKGRSGRVPGRAGRGSG